MKRGSEAKGIEICHVSTVHCGLDPRIFWKECVSLSSWGYRVALLAPGIPRGMVKGVLCMPIRTVTHRWARLFMGFSVFWSILALRPRIAHFHDPELIPVAVALRVFGLSTIYDAHEDLPRQLKQKEWAQHPVMAVAAGLYSWCLESCLRWLSAVVYVVDGQTESRMNSRSVLVRNFPRSDLFVPRDVSQRSAVLPMRVVYVGGLARGRGIGELIDAVGLLPQGQAHLVLAGWWESDRFRDDCQRSIGWGSVELLGELEHTEIPEVLRHADVGMFCPHRGSNIMRSLPLKVVEYMACGLPIVLTDIPFWQELFEDVPVYVSEPDAVSISTALAGLIDDPASRDNRAGRGLALLQRNGWYWETESAKLRRLYTSLLGDAHA